MRGQTDPQAKLFSYVSPESRVPRNHPLRRVRMLVGVVLDRLSTTFEAMYSHTGRPSIPPERLLKSCLLIALYSIRSDRMFCERLDYDLLFRWFLDMDLDSESFDASSFSKNRERLLAHDVARRFFDEVVKLARGEGLLSDEHFSVDGTLIEAWASQKSFQRKDDEDPPSRGKNRDVNFHGERRSNETHRSTTDPDARLARKAKGQPAKLCYSGNALMDHREGLCVDICVVQASGTSERVAAEAMLARQARKRVRPATLAADKGYFVRDFIGSLRQRGIVPHIAAIDDRRMPGMDKRTTRHGSYAVSMRVRKRIEEIFGWLKTIGGLRKVRVRGVQRVQMTAQLAAAAYNLVRIGRLLPATT